MPAPIEIDGIRREWPLPSGATLVAVDDLSLVVPRGSVFGLLGPNGAGKTTLMRMLTTLIPPTRGTARIEGHDLVQDPAGVRGCIGYLSASSGLPPLLTCTEAIATFADLQQVPRPRAAIARAIAQFGITGFADRFVGDLSTGMRQRVRIACATVHRPPVVILDEPTSGLDLVSARQLLDAILSARDAGATVIFSTHVLQEAEQICDRIAIVARGRLEAEGTIAELLAQTGAPQLSEAFLAVVGL